MKFHDFAPKYLKMVQFSFQIPLEIPRNPIESRQQNSLRNLPGFAKLQIKISPRLFNIFYPNIFYSETMNLLHRFRTFPALSEVFGKMRNYT